MSSKRLTNIELARFGALPRGEKRDKAIKDFLKGTPRWNYQPVRTYLVDVLNVSTLLMPMPDIQWETIEEKILDKCCNYQNPEVREQQRYYNTAKGQELYRLRHELNWSFHEYNIRTGLSVPNNTPFSYWHNALGQDENGAFLPFIDFRSNSGLNSDESRKIVFSIQYLLVIGQEADLDGTRPAIVRIEGNLQKGLKPVYYFGDSHNLYSLEEIETMALEVHDDFERVKRDTPDEVKKTGTDN
ncbi:hypothetical protein [Acetobacter orientalis]|uniref:hypothetical protein n=1 Tax=Acetobacter orientalis TaxID=146474 RepID=UPI0039EA8CDF